MPRAQPPSDADRIRVPLIYRLLSTVLVVLGVVLVAAVGQVFWGVLLILLGLAAAALGFQRVLRP